MNKRVRCKAIITGKREIENYVHFEAINEAYAQQSEIALGLTSNLRAFDDVFSAKVAEIVPGISGSEKVGQNWKGLRDKKVAKVKGPLTRMLFC